MSGQDICWIQRLQNFKTFLEELRSQGGYSLMENIKNHKHTSQIYSEAVAEEVLHKTTQSDCSAFEEVLVTLGRDSQKRNPSDFHLT